MKNKILLLLLLSLSIFTGCDKTDSIDNKLKNIGYNNSEITVIKDKLTEDDIQYLLTLSYSDAYTKLMENKDFKNENLKNYIEYYEKNSAPVDDTIALVNADITEYDSSLVSLINEKYYKKENFERYYDYLTKNPNLSTKEVVTNVNSNLDHEYYTTDYAADLSKNTLILVNKYYKLSSDYAPDNLVHVTASYGGNGQYIKEEAFEEYKKMYTDMKVLGLNLLIRSSYRSYNYQTGLYNNYVAKDGKANADTYSARPGYSEHQTGLAIDVGTPSTKNLGDFLYTDEYKWMIENAHNYGFILRYKEETEKITGYMYEPWHFRYVGKEVATYIKENDITYEEYYESFVK